MAAVSLGFGCLLLEGGLRVAGFDPLQGLHEGRSLLLRPAANSEVEYELVPGARGHAWGTYVAVNSLGFRGPGLAARQRDAFRIVILGDSVAFGAYVPAGTEFPAQMQRSLSEGSTVFEVLNLSLGGYDTTNEVALIEERASELQPSLVVVAYCLNDIAVVAHNLDYVRRLKQYEGPLYRSRLAAFVATRLDRFQAEAAREVYNRPEVFQERYAARIDPIGTDETELRGWMARAGRRLPAAWYADDFRVGRLRHAFARLHVLSASRGIPVLAAILPWLDDDQGRYPYETVHRIVDHEARRAGLDVLDLTSALLPHGLVGLRRRDNPNDACHPNENGHMLIARALAAHVRERYGSGK